MAGRSRLPKKVTISHFTRNAFLTDSGFGNALECLEPLMKKDSPEGMQPLTITMSATLMYRMVKGYMEANGIKPSAAKIHLGPS